MNISATTSKQSMVYVVWGALDAFYIAWYCINSWKGGRMPYLSDLTSSLVLLEQQGGANLATVLGSWLLQLSIIPSCLMFLLRARAAKHLAYMQIPFRLFFLIPSVSVLLLTAQLLPSLGLILLVLIIASEALKAWSLWRFA
jgi:hypothetical protein